MSRLKLSVLLFLLSLLIFSLFRGLLLVSYFEEFSVLSLSEIVSSFFYGLRFDIALTSLLIFIPLLMINLPLKIFDDRRWVAFWYWLTLLLILGICLLLAADLAYYAFVKRHITHELRLMLHDTAFILDMGINSYKLALLAFAGFAALLFYIWHKIFPATFDSKNRAQRITVFIVLFFILFIGARGGTQRKAIHIINAYAVGGPLQGNLVLNGAYSALRSFDNTPSVSHKFYPQDQLEKQARELGLYRLSERYPFQKKYNHKQNTKLNIVLVLLESWSYKYIDALTGNHLGITPNMDQLVKQGLIFDRFYAAGQRSIEGLQAVLTGVPILVDVPSLGWGLESSKFSRLGHILKQHGYHTVFAQSSRRTSFHIDGIAAATGFEEYYGMEDMTLKLDYEDPDSFWFGWDHETFNKVQSRLAEISQPFISFTFTGSTHSPYGTLPKEFLKYPHKTDTEQGFMNTIYYSDWAIGQFMQQARKQPWFDDTVFIFTADHTVGSFRGPTTLEQFHIPLVIYSPKHIKPGINSTISSHLDLMPTVIDLLGLPDRFSTVGESLFVKENNNNAVAYIRSGNITGIISNEGYLRHTLKRVIEAKTLANQPMDQATQDKLERHLLTIDQMTYQAINSNTWAE